MEKTQQFLNSIDPYLGDQFEDSINPCTETRVMLDQTTSADFLKYDSGRREIWKKNYGTLACDNFNSISDEQLKANALAKFLTPNP